MLVIEVPFGKWSHLFYRPLAIFLATLKKRPCVNLRLTWLPSGKMSVRPSRAVCSAGPAPGFAPLARLRATVPGRSSAISLSTSPQTYPSMRPPGLAPPVTAVSKRCPRGVNFLDLIRSIRRHVVDAGFLPKSFAAVVQSLKKDGNPWNGKGKIAWIGPRAPICQLIPKNMSIACSPAVTRPMTGVPARAVKGRHRSIAPARICRGLLWIPWNPGELLRRRGRYPRSRGGSW